MNNYHGSEPFEYCYDMILSKSFAKKFANTKKRRNEILKVRVRNYADMKRCV